MLNNSHTSNPEGDKPRYQVIAERGIHTLEDASEYLYAMLEALGRGQAGLADVRKARLQLLAFVRQARQAMRESGERPPAARGRPAALRRARRG